MAELADAHGSGPCGSNTLWVRLPSSALQKMSHRTKLCGGSSFIISYVHKEAAAFATAPSFYTVAFSFLFVSPYKKVTIIGQRIAVTIIAAEI